MNALTTDLLMALIPGCVIDHVECGEQGITLMTHVSDSMAACPTCRRSSVRVHSSYLRTCQDLPLGVRAVHLRLRVRRFRCGNARCLRQTFTERLPELLPSYVQRTLRLSETIREAGFALGGEAGVRLLRACYALCEPFFCLVLNGYRWSAYALGSISSYRTARNHYLATNNRFAAREEC